jgi:hypothetical protein
MSLSNDHGGGWRPEGTWTPCQNNSQVVREASDEYTQTRNTASGEATSQEGSRRLRLAEEPGRAGSRPDLGRAK